MGNDMSPLKPSKFKLMWMLVSILSKVGFSCLTVAWLIVPRAMPSAYFLITGILFT